MKEMRKALKPLIEQYKKDIAGKTPDEKKIISWDYASELDVQMAEERIIDGSKQWRKKRNEITTQTL